MALEELQPFRLPHMRNWNIIDANSTKLLESVLQDNVTVKLLVQKHEETSEWLQRALELLERDDEIMGMMKRGAKRGDQYDSCLPLLALKTYKRVEQTMPLLSYLRRVIGRGYLAVFELLGEDMDDSATVSQWLVDSIDYIEDSVRGYQ